MTPDEEHLSEREQRVADLLTHARTQTRAPSSLRHRLDEQQRTRARRGTLRTRWRTGLATATSAAALIALAVVALVGGGTAAPTLAQVAALSGRGPAGPAPAAQTSGSTVLTADVQGLHFPNWQDSGGWRSSGQRTDTVSGRGVVTVFYTRDHVTLAYSIVSTPVLKGSTAGGGDPYVTWREHGREVVIWTDQGHTCVLSGAGVSAQTLWNLAATTLE